MNRATLLVAAFSFLASCCLCGAEDLPTLTEDAAKLASFSGTTWKSGELNIQYANGSTDKKMLVLEFVRPAEANASNAFAMGKLLIESPPQGIRGVAEASISFGVTGQREIRLSEKDGIRTITLRKPPENVGGTPSKEKRERILDRTALSFAYELKGDTLTLKGFPQGVTNWGTLAFAVPVTEITFKAVK